MDVWFIYKNDEQLNPVLYAVTDKEHLKDSFIQERKKKMFIVKEKSIKKHDFNEFISQHTNLLLGRRGFETSSSSDSFISKTHIYLTSTAYEEMGVFTRADEVVNMLAKYTHGYSRNFSKELLEALNTLYYFDIYKFKNSVYIDFDDYFLSGVSTFNTKDGTYVIDSFGVFMYLYGNTLDKDMILKERI